MSLLINHITKIEEPQWEVITYRIRWWQRKRISFRIVFNYQIEGENYRIDYSPEKNEIIYVHKKPRDLLTKLGMDLNTSENWLEEQRELLAIFQTQYTDSLKFLLENTPKTPNTWRYKKQK